MKKGIYIERLLLAFSFAILLHLFLMQFVIEYLCREIKSYESVIEVEYINPLVANNFEDVKDKNFYQKKNFEEKKKKITETIKEEKEEIVEKGQIVYIGETESEKAPEKYRFLAEYNSVVERETKSRYADNNYKNPAPRPQFGENIAKRIGNDSDSKVKNVSKIIIKNENESEKRGESEKTESRLALKIPKLLKSDSIKIESSESGSVNNKEYSEEMNGRDNEFQLGFGSQQGEELRERRLAELFPQDIYTGKYSGGPFNDWLRDIEEGDSTFLNAKEYKYATFFNRVKKSVSQYWNPSNVILKYDPYGNIYGNKDRLTIVKVKIDATGNLKEIDVSQSSGVEFLDKVAIDAFRAAQPFPNPPKGLIDKNGEITFNFGFYVEFSKSSLRIFRYE